ncbi:unnamed protein product [Soboliphyme baturini]|uniref:HotDog ACOT-type domain-containing protein n=1 Tax=Soboliphyme baturini TaxID=241478 RepID=A0A183IAY1_9BILA|nr:unnamed protein product [Soboliphyme baturini]
MDVSTPVNLFEDLLEVDEVDRDVFCSRKLVSGVPGSSLVYGGQVIAQALMATLKTVPEAFHPHSLHCYFVLGADFEKPITYSVERIRDGRSIYSRHVKATQDDHTVATCEISLHKVNKQNYMFAHMHISMHLHIIPLKLRNVPS